ncbi:hypothetical protein [Streptococcus thoraltensis]
MKQKSTYEMITRELDKVIKDLHKIGETQGLLDLSVLSSRLDTIKEELVRLLWVELPELNDGKKLERLFNTSTGMLLTPGIFEVDVMRQAFFKRQAKIFFDTKEEHQAYIDYTESQYLGATKTLKEIMREINQDLDNADHHEKQKYVKEQFVKSLG